MKNILLSTDVYKMGHMEQYAPGTNLVYSYLCARKRDKQVINFGLQYYLKEYLQQPITIQNVVEFLDIRKSILGPTPDHIAQKLFSLQELGYIPMRIKTIPEGTILPSWNIMSSYVNTDPRFPWVVGFFESLLLKQWNTCTVATYSRQLHDLVYKYGVLTCDNLDFLPYSVHDFGYRGVSSEETALLSGMSHLINFLGTDTVLGVYGAKKYYNAKDPVGLSVPASEHSVMCSFGPDFEYEAFEHMLDTYPEGIVSIVSDTYNLWKVLGNFAPRLKDRILKRNGKVVFRPDSGDPEKIILGDPNGTTEEEKKGALKLIQEVFGFEINNKGYKVTNPKVGLIYGDGFYYDRFETVIRNMSLVKQASSNLVVGIGGLLLQNHNRDEFGFSMKATYIQKKGLAENIYKDPITDPGKKSHCGLMSLVKRPSHGGYYYETIDKCDWYQEQRGELRTVFEDGKLINPIDFDMVKKNSTST